MEFEPTTPYEFYLIKRLRTLEAENRYLRSCEKTVSWSSLSENYRDDVPVMDADLLGDEIKLQRTAKLVAYIDDRDDMNVTVLGKLPDRTRMVASSYRYPAGNMTISSAVSVMTKMHNRLLHHLAELLSDGVSPV